VFLLKTGSQISLSTAASGRSCQYIENETAANEGEVRGDKNVGGGRS